MSYSPARSSWSRSDEESLNWIQSQLKDLSLRKARAATRSRPRRSRKVSRLPVAVHEATMRCADQLSAEVGREWEKHSRKLKDEAHRYRTMTAMIKSHPAYHSLLKKNQELEVAVKRLRGAQGETIAVGRSETRQASDGNFYTFDEFCKYYGGLYWTEARPRPHADPVSLRVRERSAVPAAQSASVHTTFPSDGELPCNKVISLAKPAPRGNSNYHPSSSSGAESDAAERPASLFLPSDGSLSDLGRELDGSDVSDGVDVESASGSVVSAARSEASTSPLAWAADATDEAESGTESDGEEVMEIELEGVTYYASGVVIDDDSETGFADDCEGLIYSVGEDGDVGDQVGRISAGVPCIAQAS